MTFEIKWKQLAFILLGNLGVWSVFSTPAAIGESRPKPKAIGNAIDNLQAERLIPRRKINSLEQQNNRTITQR
jgi:hypothetical protein